MDSPHDAPDGSSEVLLSLEEVLRRTACKRSTLYRWIAAGLFPPPVKIGPRRVAWRKSDVDRWIATRSRAGGPQAGPVERPAARRAHGSN